MRPQQCRIAPAPALKVGSHNVRGWGQGPKVLTLLSLYAQQDLDVVCLQETHVPESRVGRAQPQLLDLHAAALHTGWTTPLWGAAASAHSTGVAVFVRSSLVNSGAIRASVLPGPPGPGAEPPLQPQQQHRPQRLQHRHADPPEGRLLGVRLRWGGHDLVIASAYLPVGSTAAEQRLFLTDTLAPWIAGLHPASSRLLLAGDFNFVHDPAPGSHGGHGSRPWDAPAAALFRQLLPDLRDTLRLRHPTPSSTRISMPSGVRAWTAPWWRRALAPTSARRQWLALQRQITGWLSPPLGRANC